MHVLHITFPYPDKHGIDHTLASQALNMLISAWRMNGQILNREWGIVFHPAAYATSLLSPESTALEDSRDNKYVRQCKQHLLDIGVMAPHISSSGRDIDGLELCSCTHVSTYILYTDYLSLESPVRCGTCFGPIPLYRLPYTQDEEYNNIVRWQSNYQACDLLFMNSTVLERSTQRALAWFTSTLSQEGYILCRLLEHATGVPTYYVLQKQHGRSHRHEQQRRCPSCGQPWRVDKPWHHFDFVCEPCRLVSNIAWNVREPSR